MKTNNLQTALLKRGREPLATGNVSVLPVAEMPMVLTLEQLRPNPDNPRTTRNPKYEEIKSSIRARGLDSVPKVTKDPDNAEDVYIFSDGGNTRYAVLSELYHETGDERFRRVQCIFKPWPGRLKCVIGHLAENEMRGDLSFIEKALGVAKARSIYEEQFARKVTQQELADLLTGEGYRVTQSNISRMEFAVTHLLPHLSALFDLGLSRSQVIPLINLYTAAEKGWRAQCQASDVTPLVTSFESVFAQACRGLEFTAITDYSLEHLKDELIGALLASLPDPAVTYDRWLIELDPVEQQKRQLFGEPAPLAEPVLPDFRPEAETASRPESQPAALGVAIFSEEGEAGSKADGEMPEGGAKEPFVPSPDKVERQPDMFGGETVLSGELSPERAGDNEEPESVTLPPSSDSVSFANVGLEPVMNIWHIPSLQDDVEHLQDMAFRLAFELAEEVDAGELIYEAKSPLSAGFRVIDDPMYSAHGGRQLLAMLVADNATLSAATFSLFVTGTADNAPLLNDAAMVKYFRLVRVIRRLRELQQKETQ